jgi:hypothetical protein
MSELDTTELVVNLVILLIVFGALGAINRWLNGGGPSNGFKPGRKFQLADSPGSVVSHCPKCGAPTKGFYENCPVCGEKIGERLAVAKTF